LDIRPIVAVWYYEGYGTLLRYITDYLSKALDRLGLSRVSLVASFMGGGVAMSLAIREPDRVNRLVLISSLGLMTRPKTSAFGLIFGLMNLPGMRTLFHLFMSDMRFQRAVLKFDKKVFGPYRVNEFFYQAPAEGLDYHLGRLYDGLGDPPNPFAFETFINVIQHLRYREIRHLIPTIEQETLLLFGEEDILIPQKIARKYKESIPNSELHFVPKARVFLHWEAADEVNRLIVEFLSRRAA
jgi:pimeloyl-ACP methyl ester carboxylesterase